MDQKFINSISKAWQEVVEKKKLDPVGQADADIDNDGDTDSSDEYLHNRRKAIKKAMKKEEKCSTCGMMNCKCKHEATDLDADNVEKALRHDCATHVASESWGYGECISGQHTLEEQEDGSAIVTHYDVMFEHGIEKDVPVEELKIMAEKSHLHASKKKKVEEDDDPCWDTHKKVGTKMKGGKRVNDCVPKNESVEESYQTVAETHEEVQDVYASVRERAVAAMKSMWEKKEPTADKKAKPDPKGQPADEIDNGLKGGGAKQMAKDLDATGTDTTKIPKGGDDEVGHDDVSKAGRVVSKQSPKRPGDKR